MPRGVYDRSTAKPRGAYGSRAEVDRARRQEKRQRQQEAFAREQMKKEEEEQQVKAQELNGQHVPPRAQIEQVIDMLADKGAATEEKESAVPTHNPPAESPPAGVDDKVLGEDATAGVSEEENAFQRLAATYQSCYGGDQPRSVDEFVARIERDWREHNVKKHALEKARDVLGEFNDSMSRALMKYALVVTGEARLDCTIKPR